jgi:hypothetical protein
MELEHFTLRVLRQAGYVPIHACGFASRNGTAELGA